MLLEAWERAKDVGDLDFHLVAMSSRGAWISCKATCMYRVAFLASIPIGKPLPCLINAGRIDAVHKNMLTGRFTSQLRWKLKPFLCLVFSIVASW
jgi:hypothetical protein